MAMGCGEGSLWDMGHNALLALEAICSLTPRCPLSAGPALGAWMGSVLADGH